MGIYTLPKQFSVDFQSPNKKPIGEIEIDWTNPLTKGLVGCYADNDITRNLVTGVETVGTGTSLNKSQFGAGVEIANASNNKIDTQENPTAFTGSNNRTLLIGGNFLSSYPDSAATLYSIGSNATGARWNLRLSSGALRVEIQGSGYTSSLSLGVGFHVAGIKLDGSTLAGHTLFLDGQMESATGSSTVNTATLNTGRFWNSLVEGSTHQVTGTPLLFGYLYNRALSDSEIFALCKNPYQILKPKSPSIYFTVDGVAPSESITIDSGTYTISGTVTPIKAALNTVPASGAYSQSGTSTPIKASLNVIASSGTYSVSGANLDLRFGSSLVVGSGSYSITGTATPLVFTAKMTLDSGSYIITGTDINFSSSGNPWSDKSAVVTSWTDQSGVTTTWTEQTPTSTTWTNL